MKNSILRTFFLCRLSDDLSSTYSHHISIMYSLRPLIGSVRRPFISTVLAQRNVFVMSNEKKRRTKKVAAKPKPILRPEPQHKREEVSKAEQVQKLQHTKRLREFEKLTRSVNSYLASKNRGVSETLDEEDPVDELYQSIKDKPVAPKPSISKELTKPSSFDPLKSTLASPAVALPESIQDRMGLALKYLVNKDHQDWDMVLRQLELEGGFKGLVERDVRKFVYAIPRPQLHHVFPKIEELLEAAGMQKSPKIINAYMKSVIHRGTVGLAEMEVIEKCVEHMKSVTKKGELSRETYEILVEAYGKNSNIDKVNETVAQMKQLGLEPLKNVYSNVLATCVYKTKSHEAAVLLFDSMKFFSKKTQPSTREYQDIIVSYVNNNDIEKALDLYQEMLLDKVEVNQNIVVALARGCFNREEYKVRAWDFMFEVHKRDWTPTVQTAEYMLYLALRDGDLPLARALYQQLNLAGNTSPRSFSFLLLAYANASLEGKTPTIFYNESGRLFRHNIINQTELNPSVDDPKKAIPFLPKLLFESPEEVLAESSAVMAHTMMVNHHFVNTESINTFLNVAANCGSLAEFCDRLELFTYLDREGVPASRSIIEPEDVETDNETKEITTRQTSKAIEKSPILQQLLDSSAGRYKVPRNTITYLIALKAAAKHKDYAFAQSMWTERGLYRKSAHWRQLSRQEKDKLDFDFALAMVNSLTRLGLFDDALAIIVSTEYQFKWKRHHFSQLYKEAVEVGDSKITQTLRGIAKRAQVNFEGKIRRRDYKRFVMENGY